MRELLFAAALLAAASSVTVGVALLLPAAAWIVGGVLFALWSWLVLGDAA